MFDTLAQLFVLVTTVGLFCSFPPVLSYFGYFGNYSRQNFPSFLLISRGLIIIDEELERQVSVPERHLIRFEILIKLITRGSGRRQWN